MKDHELFALIVSTLEPVLQSQYDSSYGVVMKDQPTQQGVSSDPTVYFEKLFDKRVGWTRRDVDYFAPKIGPQDTQMPTTDMQLYETTVQFTALVLQDPANLSIPTASDLVNYVAMALANDMIMAAFRKGGAAIQRITVVRNPWWVNDYDRFEASPTFDVVFQHHRDFALTVPEISATEVKTYPV